MGKTVHRRRGPPVLAALLILPLAGIVFVVSELTTPGAREDRVFSADFVRVIDADTLAVGNTAIRLQGIAAPEKGHPDFDRARHALGRLVRNADTVACSLSGARSHGRRLGLCHAVRGDGTRTDLQAAMVKRGFARACPGWGVWRYLIHENARSLGLPFPGYCLPG